MTKKKKIIIIIVSAVAAVIVLIFGALLVKYGLAVKDYKNGDTKSAYQTFCKYDFILKSKEYAKEIEDTLINTAEKAKKDTLDYAFFAAYKKLIPYSSMCDEIMDYVNKTEEQYPELSLLKAKERSTVTFGKYEQDNNTSNGKEDIEWYVVENSSKGMLLISKYILDWKEFNNSTLWDCSLNNWLKNDFSNAAFSNTEKSYITRIAVPLTKEYYSILLDERTVDKTAYALAKSNYKSGNNCWWVQNSEDGISYDGEASVHYDVMLVGYEIDEPCGVRPALWLFADKSQLPEQFTYTKISPK